MARSNNGRRQQKQRGSKWRGRGYNDRRSVLSIESLETRIALDGTGLAGNECPPDLDLSAVTAQQVTVGQTLTLDLLNSGGTVTDLDASGTPTGDVIRLLLDPDVPSQTPDGAAITPEGVFTWTPVVGQVGTFSIVVIAVDQGTPPLADAETFVVEVVEANLAPGVDLNGAATGIDFSANFTEDGGPVAAVDSADLVVSDADDTTLESATVTLTNLSDGASEVLAVDVTGTSIVADYNDTTGVLSLSGTDTLAAYQQVLRTLSYDNTSQDPTAGDRVIEVVVNDGTSDSLTATSTVSVAALNDAPVLDLNGTEAGADFETTFVEGGGAVAIVGAELTVVDVDSTTLVSAAITITNLLDGASEVLAVDVTGTSIVADYNDTTGVLSLTGTDTLAAYQQVLRTLTYNNTESDPNSAARAVEVVVNDGTDASVIRTATVNVAILNNAPNLASIDDQMGFAGEEIVIPFSATDADAGDTLLFELDQDNSPVGAQIFFTSGEKVGEVRWTPSASDIGNTVGFVVLVSDNGTPVRVDSEAFSVTVQAPRPVVDLNGADPGTGVSATFTEDGGAVAIAEVDLSITTDSSATIDLATITITDPREVAQEVLAVDTTGTSISANYSNGVLSLSGADTLANYTAVLATLTYEHTSQDPTAGDRTVEVVVNDGAADSLPAVAVVSVVAVNDTPDLVVPSFFDNGSALTIENGLQSTFSVTTTDADHGPGELFYAIDSDGSGLPAGATLPTISASDADPPGQFVWSTDAVGTFTFRIIVTDAEGGVDQELVTYTVTELTPPTVVSAPSGTFDTTFSTIVIEFSEPLLASSFDVANFSLQIIGGANDGQQVAISSVESNGNTRTIATLTLASPLPDENYRLSLVDTAIIGSQSQTLAGDSTFDFTVDAVAAAFAAFGDES